MDLDDDELWFTRYKRNYVSKDKIRDKIKELEKKREIYEELESTTVYWEILSQIQVLNELLEE